MDERSNDFVLHFGDQVHATLGVWLAGQGKNQMSGKVKYTKTTKEKMDITIDGSYPSNGQLIKKASALPDLLLCSEQEAHFYYL